MQIVFTCLKISKTNSYRGVGLPFQEGERGAKSQAESTVPWAVNDREG